MLAKVVKWLRSLLPEQSYCDHTIGYCLRNKGGCGCNHR